MRNKFDSLADIVNNNIDILVISETKLDLSVLTGQFHISDFFEPYSFDRNGNGGGIFLYICEDIPSKLISMKMTIEGLFVKISLKKSGRFANNTTPKNP